MLLFSSALSRLYSLPPSLAQAASVVGQVIKLAEDDLINAADTVASLSEQAKLHTTMTLLVEIQRFRPLWDSSFPNTLPVLRKVAQIALGARVSMMGALIARLGARLDAMRTSGSKMPDPIREWIASAVVSALDTEWALHTDAAFMQSLDAFLRLARASKSADETSLQVHLDGASQVTGLTPEAPVDVQGFVPPGTLRADSPCQDSFRQLLEVMTVGGGATNDRDTRRLVEQATESVHLLAVDDAIRLTEAAVHFKSRRPVFAGLNEALLELCTRCLGVTLDANLAELWISCAAKLLATEPDADMDKLITRFTLVTSASEIKGLSEGSIFSLVELVFLSTNEAAANWACHGLGISEVCLHGGTQIELWRCADWP
ncbi:hypothetical protein HK105_202143 [Polyrhizophydium stewartii]|uniref:Uncharacterized protein n=1 Tax=Polyrhizophydium stewartii TaxID=2732419 RepID=A0ABR4NFC2_9FUNG